MSCYRSPSWIEYIRHRNKTKIKEKGKTAELEKAEVPVRPGSKSTKQTNLNLAKIKFPTDSKKICKLIVINCSIPIYLNNKNLSYS